MAPTSNPADRAAAGNGEPIFERVELRTGLCAALMTSIS
jgi:hypothetical protein